MRYGEIDTDSNGKGILSFPDFKQPMSLMLSIKSFAIGQNVRSLGCYANLLNLSENKYQFFIYGTESTVGEGTSWISAKASMTTQYSKDGVISITINNLYLTTNGNRYFGNYTLNSRYSSFDISESYKKQIMSEYVVDLKYSIKIYQLSSNEISLIYNKEFTEITKVISGWDTSYGSGSDIVVTADLGFNVDKIISINKSFTAQDLSTLGYKIEIGLVSYKVTYPYVGYSGYKTLTINPSTSTLYLSTYADGVYNNESIVSLTGNGTLFYIAMED